MPFVFDLFVEIPFVSIFSREKNSTAIWTKNLAWKFYPFWTHNTVRDSLCAVLKMKFHTRMTSDQRENCVRPFVFTWILYIYIFFLPRGKVHPGEKKLENSKVDFCMNWRQIDGRLCGPILAEGTESIDQSVSQFAEWWASGTAIPENFAFARFRSPRLFMEAMQFTDNGLYTLAEKKEQARIYTHVRTSPQDDATLIEFLDPRHSAWLFVTRAIYLRVILLLRRRFEKEETKKNEDSRCVSFDERILQICAIFRSYTVLRHWLGNFFYPYIIRGTADYPWTAAFSRWMSVIRMQIMKFKMIKWNRCRNFYGN